MQVLRIALTLAAGRALLPLRRDAHPPRCAGPRLAQLARARHAPRGDPIPARGRGGPVGVVASLGIGLTAAKVPTLEDDLGGITAVGDDPLVPTASPTPGSLRAHDAPPPRVPPARPPGVDAFGLSSTATGDSVLLAASEAMGKTFPGMTVDAAVSRQSRGVFARIKARKDAGKLGDVVVISTGTNGTVLASDLTEMLTALSDRSRVVLVTPKAPRSWIDKNISVIKSVAASFPNVRVADWNSYARGHREWFYADGIHTKGAGSQAYAALIRETMRR